MKLRRNFVACILLATPILHARAESPAADGWRLAREAYDAGRYDESYRLYAGIAIQPGASAEAQFNTGNAAYRMNDPGHAVLWYRRAERQSPRDPDIRSNLDRALKLGGADPARASTVDRALRRASAAEWSLLSVIACGIACLGLVGWAVFRGAVAAMARRTAIAGALLWLVSVAGAQSWRRADSPQEAVVTDRGIRALFAPIPDSTVHFALPPGSIVRILEQTGDWVKISQANREGWIRHESLEMTALGN